MAEMRQEKDSLGVVEVPAGAMYGAQTQRAVENYPISGMRAAGALIRAIGMVKKAAAEANGELGVVSKERAEAIASAAQEVIDGEWDGEFVVDVFQAGAGVSFHMNANEVIANRANQLVARFKVLGSRFEVGDAESVGAAEESGPQGLKPAASSELYGTAEAVPLTKGGEERQVGGDTTTTTEILRVAQNDDGGRGSGAEGAETDEHALLAAERAALGKYEWVHPNDHVNYGQS